MEKCTIRESLTREQLSFLHRCRNNKILPKSVRIKSAIKSTQGYQIAIRYGQQMLGAFITDAHHRLRKFTEQKEQHMQFCIDRLPVQVFETLQETITHVSELERLKKRSILDKKWMTISRKGYNDSSSSKKVINLSSRVLTTAEENVLSKGMKYNPSDSDYLNFLASFESIITSAGLTEEEQFTIRNSTVQALKNRNKFSTLSGDEKEALNSLKTDENTIILPADKGGSTTIMNKTDYTEKMMTLLKDESTYEPLDADPTKSQNSCIEKTLKRLTGKKLISGDLAKSLKQDEPTIAKIYGLPKVHKIGIPLRPIVSLIGAPNYKISKWLFHHLHPLTKDSENSIEDSNEFLDKLNGVSVATDEIMVSFDVVSLFTSIPLDLARHCTEELLQTYTTDVPADALLQLLDVCLEANFSFAKQF
ncbi:hypothetical protein SprV_0401622000 [Sparganum proliferum]